MAAAKAMAVVRAMASAAGRYDRTGPGCRSAELPATSLGNDSGNKNAQARGPGHNLAAWTETYIPKRGHEVKRFLVNDAEVPCSRSATKRWLPSFTDPALPFGRQRGVFLIGRRLYRVARSLMPSEESLRAILQGVQLVGSGMLSRAQCRIP